MLWGGMQRIDTLCADCKQPLAGQNEPLRACCDPSVRNSGCLLPVLVARRNFARDLLAERSRRLAALWVAIEARSEEPFWRVKPKLHQFQHLCETTGSLPTESWTYRDEDFGGTMSRLARSRGGPRSASAVARNVLLKFIARHPVPLIG